MKSNIGYFVLPKLWDCEQRDRAGLRAGFKPGDACLVVAARPLASDLKGGSLLSSHFCLSVNFKFGGIKMPS